MASPRMGKSGGYRTLADSLVGDTVKDSVALMIEAHNKNIDDSIRLDSLNRAKSNGINSPVEFAAKDSMVYDARRKNAYFYGESSVKYENMDLKSAKVSMSMDSSLVRASGVTDSLGKKIGAPVFQMGSDTYESDTMAFNFKTKKGFINNVYTAQQDGFLTAEIAKRDSSGVMYLKHGRYTTCDEEHPDFYIALSRAKVRPGKDVVFGPAYLVVADVPLPLAIPYGFFPFSKSYSSGFIMPTYGDEMSRGFYLRDGGYYFAISDKIDLKLLGEIYTKGSWGFSAASNYRKRYKYNGSFYFSYQDTRTGEKGLPDYTKQESYKIQWRHTQDAHANPYSQLSASINFASSSYERNNLTSLYNPQAMSQSLRTSSVSWSTGFSSLGMTLSTSANISQNMRDSTLQLSLPDLNINVSRFYPFKRKAAVGKERWYEKIAMSYTGQLSMSIDTKEDMLFKSNLIKDWKNGFQHSIPISGTFSLFKYINVTASFNITDRMYTQKNTKYWDSAKQSLVDGEKEYGFYNLLNWSMSLSASTKRYGFYTPNRKIFGDKIMQVRHVWTPKITFSYNPDFAETRYAGFESYLVTDKDGNPVLEDGRELYRKYNPFSSNIFGAPGSGKTGSIGFDVSNNIEMKVKSETDSIGYKKISIIDELGANMSYNMAAEKYKWSDLSMRIRFKLSKSFTFHLNPQFATYAYKLNEQGNPEMIDRTEYSFGRFGRFQGMSQSLSYSLTPDKLRKLFSGEKSKKDDDKDDKDDDDDTGVETNIDDTMEKAKRSRGGNTGMAETDDDGYLLFSMPWSLNLSYNISMRENRSDYSVRDDGTLRFRYKFTQIMGLSGNIQLSKGWNISFNSGYDFDNHKISTTSASLSRDLHCFNMSASVVLAPFTSYNFSFRCNAATLTDALKYDKRSGYTNNVKWY